MRGFTRVTLQLLAALPFAPLPAGAAAGQVLRQFPTPGRCPTGIAFLDGALWLADRRSDLLYEIGPGDGEVLGSLPAPGHRIEGLCSDDSALWALDAEEKQAFRLDPRTGVVEDRIPIHCASPQALAFDGAHLWVADLKAQRLLRVAPEDGTTLAEIPSPAQAPHGLAFDGRYLWVADRLDDMIYMVEPGQGQVIVAFPSPGPFPRGLAFRDAALWNVDYQDDAICEIRPRDREPYARKPGRRELLEYVHEVRNHGPGTLAALDIYLAVPPELSSQTLLGPPVFTPEPHAFVTDRWGQRLAHYHYEEVPANQVTTVAWEAKVELQSVRFFLFPEGAGALADIPAAIREEYLGDGAKYCVNDPLIQQTVRDVVGAETNSYWIARRLFEHVTAKVRYERTGGWNAAPVVLKRGTGSCSEYSFVTIALCRAAGLPARYVGSVVVRGDDASTDDGVFHRWPEVYLPGYGWVPFDASSSAGPGEAPARKASMIGYRDDRYLITTIGAGDSEQLRWDYNSRATWKARGPCRVETERFGEWSPLPAAEAAPAP